MNSLSETFKSENIKLLFDNRSYGTEYIADARNCFTEYLPKETFTANWTRNCESGRYVLFILQRHSVYESGSCIYKNENFEYTIGRFSSYKRPCFFLISDRSREYRVSSWDRPFETHYVNNEFYDEEKAIEEAKRLSLLGEKIAVMKLYEDHNMF